MKILAADTSTGYNSVALCEDDHVLAESVVDAGRKHSERLLETVDWVLGEAGHTLRDVDLLAVSIGPGSFTGLRVGASTWKGLAFAAELPLAGVPTLDAMTRLSAFTHGTVCPLLDAKMQEVYGAAYGFEKGMRTKLIEDRVCSVESIVGELSGEALYFGDGAEN